MEEIGTRGVAAAVLAAWLAAATGTAGSAARPVFTLVDSGRAVARIAIPAPPSAIDRRAAEMLQAAVREMSGATLPIAEVPGPGRGGDVAIGFAGRAVPEALRGPALSEDGFLVATAGRNLYIRSGGHKGSIYGVVHLLERYFGCRRFSPTAAVFPRAATLSVGAVRDADQPFNTLRIVNGDFSRDADYRDWQRLDSTDEVFGRGYYVHTFERLVPWASHFAGHPEYFAWMNGKRVKDQLCLSEPAVLQVVIERLAAEMAAQPDRHVWSVSQNDNFSYCQCPRCRQVIEEEGSPAGPIVRFVNAVAAHFPRQTISTLAYQYSRRAPRVTKPAPNVQVMLCTIELNRSRPIETDEGSRDFVRDIVEWGRIAPNLYLWDYTVNFNHHVSPFPNLHVLQPNLQFFVRHGARQHFQQSNTGAGHEFSELKSYLIARLLWKPDADAAAIEREFVDGYYGAAAPWIRRYISGLRDGLPAGGGRLDIYETPVAHADDCLSAGRVAQYDAWFDEAEAAVQADTARLLRVRTARLPLQYARLEIGKNDMFGPRGFYVEQGRGFSPKPAMTRLLEDFFATATAAGVRNLSESGLTPRQYYDAARRFIDVQVDENRAFRQPVTAHPPPSAKYGGGRVAMLTDGVKGASDFRVHWLGWEGDDAELVVDLGAPGAAGEVSVGTLWDARSWILHPRSVSASVSADGEAWDPVGTERVEGDQRDEPVTRTFTFRWTAAGARYVRLRVENAKQLPDWHASAGGTSWFFVDEIVVR